MKTIIIQDIIYRKGKPRKGKKMRVNIYPYRELIKRMRGAKTKKELRKYLYPSLYFAGTIRQNAQVLKTYQDCFSDLTPLAKPKKH